MIDYSWASWLKALATRIAENDLDFLVERAKAVNWISDNPALLRYGDEGIDPMSFLYFLAQKVTKNQFDIVFSSVHDVFKIGMELPESWPYIPVPTPNTSVLFHNGRSFNPDLLWNLFTQAAPIHETPIIDPGDFEAVLGLPNVGLVKLTQTLFIENPAHYLPADASAKGALSHLPDPKNIKSYEDYSQWMETIKDLFPGCDPDEINVFLTSQSRKPLISQKTKFFQISTNAYNDGTDYWKRTDEFEPELSFDENHYVYTGGPGNKIKFSLMGPKPGDVILVRYSPREGRAIGVVAENEYASDGWNEDAVIRAHWINKTSALLRGTENMKLMRAFSRARGFLSAFRDTEAYQVTFEWLDRLTGTVGSSPGTEPPTTASVTSFPLNIILYGPPGTGKTWEAVSRAVAIIDGKSLDMLADNDRERVKRRFEALKNEERIQFVTFHQNYAYEDFIEGIRPRLNQNELAYELHVGIFRQIASRAEEHDGEPHVLVIDEINRGNIAKIFGELITLIEPSKRLRGDDRTKVTLPYSGCQFGVPSNLYLIGTMNTADRGIALLDTALRRRFDFIEKMPDESHVDESIDGVDARAMLKAMNERITAFIDREHQIGHTYLIGINRIEDLAIAFRHRIMPLLQEYFYDDRGKIRQVLNRNPFIYEVRISSPGAGPEHPVLDVISRDDDSWLKPESYRRIYSDDQAEAV